MRGRIAGLVVLLCSLAAPASASVYIADVDADVVRQFSGGALTPLSPATVPVTAPLAIGLTPDGR
ncbi:MAG TPA: hypothetical protein VFZ89_00295, partial [Solirubrobacteraceae bacterium]